MVWAKPVHRLMIADSKCLAGFDTCVKEKLDRDA